MLRFTKQSQFRASPAELFAFHERPDAFSLLQAPWQTVEIIQPPSSLAVGTRVILRTRVGPVWQRIVAEHVAYEPGVSFADRMVEGPFKSWLHRHIVKPDGGSGSILLDDVSYELPLGALGRVAGGWYVRNMLERLFDYRHEVTRRYVEGS